VKRLINFIHNFNLANLHLGITKKLDIMKISSFVSLTTLPVVAAGVLLSANSAQAGFLTPPTEQSIAAFSPITVTAPTVAGANFKLVDPDGGGPAPEVAVFDFQPPTGVGYGQFKIDNSQPLAGNTFTNVTGVPTPVPQIKDINSLPFLGVGSFLNLNIDLTSNPNFTAFLDFDPTGGDALIDTFDATTLTSIVFIDVSPTSAFAEFSFKGFYNIEVSPGVVHQFEGTVALSQSISIVQPGGIPVTQFVINAGRTAQGFQTSYSGQTSVIPKTPEPASILGLAFVGVSALVIRKRQA
jgi:hypothetical protein